MTTSELAKIIPFSNVLLLFMRHQSFQLSRYLGLLVLTVMAFLLPGCNQAQDSISAPLIQSFAWKMDTSGQATLAEVVAATDWQTFDGDHQWGFGKAPVWIRLHLRASTAEETKPWIVLVRPPYLDDLILYDPEKLLTLRSGRSISDSDNALGSINFSFEIPPHPHSRDIYLRMQTKSARSLQIDVMPLHQAQQTNRFEEWLMGGFLTTSIMFALWATLQWFLNRDSVIGTFAIKQWTAALWAFTTLGYARVLLGSYWNSRFLEIFENTTRIWILAITAWFLITLLQEYKPSRTWLRICKSYSQFVFALTFLQFLDLTTPMLIMNNVSVLVLSVLLLIALFSTDSSHEHQSIPRYFLLAYLLLYTAVNSVASALRLGLMPLNSSALSGSLTLVFLDGLVMVVLLQLRARNLALQAQRMTESNKWIALERDMAQKGMVLEQRRRQEQSQFLHMLGHELRNPLSAVNFLADQNTEEGQKIRRAVQDMNLILERSLQAERLDDADFEALLGTVHLPALLQELSSRASAERLQLRLHHLPEHIETDKLLLSIVLGNLQDNALKYSPATSVVTVDGDSVNVNGQPFVRLRFTNEVGAAGMPDARELFKKYYRSPEAHQQIGSGLGLYLVYGLLKILGGTIEYVPVNQGLRRVVFEVSIPVGHAT